MEVYMKYYCLKNKNGNYSIRGKLDGIMTEFARLSNVRLYRAKAF